MIIKVKRVDGFVEVWESEKYTLTTLKELHPAIISADVFTPSGVRVAHIHRPFPLFYKLFIFKPEMIEEEKSEVHGPEIDQEEK